MQTVISEQLQKQTKNCKNSSESTMKNLQTQVSLCTEKTESTKIAYA